MVTGLTMQATNVNLVMLLARSVQVQRIQSVLLAIQGFSFNHRQQFALTFVQLDILETLRATLVCNVMFLVQIVVVQVTTSALRAIQIIFSSPHLQTQHVFTLALQLDIGRTLQTTSARLAILLVRFVQMQITTSAQNAIQDIFYSPYLTRQHV